MQDLNVTLLQRELAWENPEANREQFAADLEIMARPVDLVLLPEMFTTGFSMAAKRHAEPLAETTLPWLQAQASRHDVALCGSLAVSDGPHIFNRLLFVTPEGYRHYDKRHLFRLSGEDRHYAGGADKLIVKWRGWRLCPLICYDLRFPVWSRNRDDYDALIYIANWPAKRRRHWRQLLIARAIENQACCLGLNRVGRDGNGLDYVGDSLAIAADGQLLLDCAEQSGLFRVTLSAAALQQYRSKFPCHLDADQFALQP